jgi:hypothetical protein
MNKLSNTTEYIRNQQVLELFLNGNDKRLRIISEIVGVTDKTVSTIIGKYYAGEIFFERKLEKIYHSKINEASN